MNAQTYKGTLIFPCERPHDAHKGRWAVEVTHHPTGLVASDELCPHFHTLREAKEYIRERTGHTGEF